MAGEHLGASAPVSNPPPLSGAPRPILKRTTRTRVGHGASLIGDALACVFSSRRHSDGLGVQLEVGSGAVVLNCDMRPAQARTLARSLIAAAEACDAAAERRGAVHQVAAAMQAQRGGHTA